MRRMMFVGLVVAFACFLTGCTYWHREGAGFKECQQDLAQCHSEMKKYADTDYITTYEPDFVKDCMKEKGYKLVLEHQLPKKVKRQDPHSQTFWLMAGVSGELEE